MGPQKWRNFVSPKFQMAPRRQNNGTGLALGIAATALAGALAAGFLIFNENDKHEQQQRQREPLVMEEIWQSDIKEFEDEKEAKERGEIEQDNGDKVLVLLQMGFPKNEVVDVLKMMDYDLDRTIEWFLSRGNNDGAEIEIDTRYNNQEVYYGNGESSFQDDLNFRPEYKEDIELGQPLEEVGSSFSGSANLDPKEINQSNPAEVKVNNEVKPEMNAEPSKEESWIQKERREIQARLEYLELLEKSESENPKDEISLIDLKPEPVIIKTPIEKESEDVYSSIPDLDENHVSSNTSLVKENGSDEWDVISEHDSQ